MVVRSQISFRNGSLNGLMLLSLLWLIFSLDAKAGEPTHVLTLADGSICYGSLLPNKTEGQVLFQVEGLVQPLQFPQGAVRSLRKLTLATEDAPAKAPKGSNWLIRLSNQQTIVGGLESLDQNGLTIVSSSVGKVQIPRDQLIRIEQDSAAREPIKTVLQKAEWKDPNEMNSWKIDPSRASTSASGARLMSDFAVPGRCEIRMNLRWGKKPNFAISFGVDKSSVGPDKAQWGVAQGVKIATTGRKQSFASIETWGDDILFVRESSTEAALEQLGTTAGTSCELSIYLDIKEGLAAARMNNTPLKRLKIDSKVVAGKLQAMQFQNFSGDLAIENLEILKWNGKLPLDYFGQPSFVQNNSGEKLDGFVDRYDPEAKTFMVKSGEEEKVVPITELMSGALKAEPEAASTDVSSNSSASTETPAEKNEAPKVSPAIVTLIDGGVLVGNFLPAEDGALRLSSTLGSEALRVPVAAIQEITSPDTSGPSDEPDLMIAKCGLSEFKGRLVQQTSTENIGDSSNSRSALIWQQTLSANSSELDYSIAGELAPLKQTVMKSSSKTPEANQPRPADPNAIFQIFGLGEPIGDTAQNPKPAKDKNATEQLTGSLIRFRSGDSTPAKILQINEKGVRFESDRTTTTFAPNSTIDQIVLRAAKSKNLPDDQRKRLLTIPRAQQNDPPTHLLISTAGDFLRGHLVDVNNQRAAIEVRGEMLEVPVAELSEVIWLFERDWKTPKEKGDEQAAKPDAMEKGKREVYIVYGGKQGIALGPTKVADGIISGVSDLLGSSQVPISELTVLFWGPNTCQKARELRNQSYRLTLAQMPREAPDDEEGGSSQSTSHPLVGKPAPNFKLKNLAGETVQLEKLKGKVIVLDFWATWCGPCMQTMPLLDQMMAEFDSSKVQLYAVNIQEAKNRINLALSRLKIDPEVLLDEEGEIGNAYQANAIPQTVIIDAEGNVVKVFVGGGAGVVNQIRNALVDHLETSKN